MTKQAIITLIMIITTSSVFGYEFAAKCKLEKMRQLKKGTSYNEIVKLFGEPDEELGSGLLIIGYIFGDTEIVLHFFTGNTLQGLYEVKNNTEMIVHIPLDFEE